MGIFDIHRGSIKPQGIEAFLLPFFNGFTGNLRVALKNLRPRMPKDQQIIDHVTKLQEAGWSEIQIKNTILKEPFPNAVELLRMQSVLSEIGIDSLLSYQLLVTNKGALIVQTAKQLKTKIRIAFNGCTVDTQNVTLLVRYFPRFLRSSKERLQKIRKHLLKENPPSDKWIDRLFVCLAMRNI
jgi:hypothetical protein